MGGRKVRWLAVALAVAGSASACSDAAVELPEPAGSVTGSSPPPPDRDEEPDAADRAGLRRERAIVALLNRASREVERDPACRQDHPIDRPMTFTDAAPSEDLLATFAVLRRPQTEAERIADEQVRGLPAMNVYRSAYRIATSVPGRQYLIVAAENTNLFRPRPPQCADALRAAFEERLEGRRAAFKREARTMLSQIVRDEWTGDPGAAVPHEGLFMFDYAHGRIGGGGGGADIAFVREHGMLSSTGNATQSTVSALLPDGVATVELTWSRTASRGRYRPPKRYKRAVTLTAEVRENVISLRAPRPPGDAFPARMVWKDADGRTVRVVRNDR